MAPGGQENSGGALGEWVAPSGQEDSGGAGGVFGGHVYMCIYTFFLVMS